MSNKIIPLLLIGAIYLMLRPKKASAAVITKHKAATTVHPSMLKTITRYTTPPPGLYIAEIVPFSIKKTSTGVRAVQIPRSKVIQENISKAKNWRMFYGR